MKKMRRCVVCHSYTISSYHCGLLAGSAHPLSFKSLDPYGSYRRVQKGISDSIGCGM